MALSSRTTTCLKKLAITFGDSVSLAVLG